ncbi:MAG: Wzz/FepE/Etk N-terminal domain-containing protein [Eubacteriales bacterium]|nr:Wzz/FepE/Etk N-terminal domain-containing protein [Eubacteriales bacterium]
METRNRESDEIEIDLRQIFDLLLHWLWLIVLCAVIGGGAAFLYSKFMVTEQYQSTTKVVVLTRENNSSVTYSDVQLGTQLTKDYAELIRSRYVLQETISELGLNYTYEQLYGMVSVDTPTDTRILSITVTNPSPELARDIANTVRTISAQQITDVMDIKAVNLVDEANLPVNPSSPNKMKWAMTGFLAGALLCIAVIVIRFIADDTVKTPDDVENFLGLSTLGMIPYEEGEGGQGGRKRRGIRQKDKSGESGGGRESRQETHRGESGSAERKQDAHRTEPKGKQNQSARKAEENREETESEANRGAKRAEQETKREARREAKRETQESERQEKASAEHTDAKAAETAEKLEEDLGIEIEEIGEPSFADKKSK